MGGGSISFGYNRELLISVGGKSVEFELRVIFELHIFVEVIHYGVVDIKPIIATSTVIKPINSTLFIT